MFSPELLHLGQAIILGVGVLILAEIRHALRSARGEWRCPDACEEICRCPPTPPNGPSDQIKAPLSNEKSAKGN